MTLYIVTITDAWGWGAEKTMYFRTKEGADKAMEQAKTDMAHNYRLATVATED